MSNPAPTTSGRQAAVPATAWLLLVLLTAINVLNFVVRQLIPSLAPLLIADLGLSRGQIGTLVGFAFVIVYSVVGLLLGIVADRWPRRVLIAAGLALWSAMSVASGAARGFTGLAVPRVFSGIGQAALTPAALAMLGDAFPRARLGFASGVYYAGLPIGTALSLALAGWVAPHHGWRACFYLAGFAGLAALALVAIARDPAANASTSRAAPPRADEAATATRVRDERRQEIRGAAPAHAPGRPTLATITRDVWHALRDRPALFLVMLGGAALTYGSAAATHGVTWLVQERGFTFAGAAWLSAVMVVVSGFAGNLGGGWFSDWCARRWSAGRAWSLVLLTLFFAPFSVAFYLLPPSGALFYGCWFVSAASTVAFFGPVFSAVQELSPAHVRASLVAFALLVLNVVGVGPGSLITGAIGDRASLTLGLALSVGVTVAGTIPMSLAARYASTRITLQ